MTRRKTVPVDCSLIFSRQDLIALCNATGYAIPKEAEMKMFIPFGTVISENGVTIVNSPISISWQAKTKGKK